MTYRTSVPVVKNGYPSSGYGDDLSVVSLWLGLAQNDSTLIPQAKGYFDQFQLGSTLPDSVFDWVEIIGNLRLRRISTGLFRERVQEDLPRVRNPVISR